MSEKKHIPLLILKILEKFSSCERTLTKAEICRLLEKEYGVNCDRRTVTGAIESLISHGYKINFQVQGGKKSNLFLEPLLSKEEEKILSIALATSRYADKKTEQKIKDKLFKVKSDDLSFKSQKISLASNDFIIKLDKLFSAIQEKYMVNFSISTLIINNKHVFDTERNTVAIHLVKPLEIIFAYGRALLFCEIGDSKMYRYFPIEQLYDIQITKSKFETFEEITAPLPKSEIESKTLCFSERQRAVIRIDNCYLTEFSAELGDSCEITSRYGEKTELTAVCDLRALKRLILSYGAHAEALAPTKLRRAVAQELQAANSKYPEIRRLRGSI